MTDGIRPLTGGFTLLGVTGARGLAVQGSRQGARGQAGSQGARAPAHRDGTTATHPGFKL